MRKRLSKDEYLWHISFAVAKRGTCDRFQGGCVIAREGIFIASGYVGSAPGESHCNEAGHEMVRVASLVDMGHGDFRVCDDPEVHCIRTIHAEINAIVNAAYLGVSIADCDWYFTGVPCSRCSMAIARLKPRRLFMCAGLGCVEDNKDETISLWRGRDEEYGHPAVVVASLKDLAETGVIKEGDISALTAGRDKTSSKG